MMLCFLEKNSYIDSLTALKQMIVLVNLAKVIKKKPAKLGKKLTNVNYRIWTQTDFLNS